jgi:hypothetical protein
MEIVKKIIGALIGGALGGAIFAALLWFFGHWHISGYFGLTGRYFHPVMSVDYMIPRVIAGAAVGMLFPLPFMNDNLYIKGALIACLPLGYLLLIILPSMGYGNFGMRLSELTPIFVGAWGLIAAMFASFTYASIQR